jgi:hypothetical protein
VRLFFIARMIMTAWGLAVSLVFAAKPELAGEAARAGRLTREQDKSVAHLCAGCLGPWFETVLNVLQRIRLRLFLPCGFAREGTRLGASGGCNE